MAGRTVAAAVVLTGLLAGCSAPTGGVGAAASSTPAVRNVLQPCPPQPDRPATGSPRLPALRFSCPGGGTLDLGRAPGVPTVVNVWGSWCGPCREELPLVQQLADAAGRRVTVIGVITKDGLPQAESFAADAGVTFPSAFDGQGDLTTRQGLNGAPYTFFLDADGGLRFTQVGQVQSLAQLEQLVGTHLGVRL